MPGDKLDFGKNYLLLNQKLDNHIQARNNPHKVSKADINLSEVENLPLDSEVTEGSVNYISSGAVFSALKDMQQNLDSKQDKLIVNSVERTVSDLTSVKIDGINYAISVQFDSSLNTQSRNGVQNRVVTDALNSKQNVLFAGDSIRLDNETSTISVLKDNSLDETSTGLLPNNVIKAALDTKQDSLTETQIAAINSNITSAKVSTYDGYATLISAKADKETTYTKNDINTLLAAKQALITSSNKLSTEYINDENSSRKFVSIEDKTRWDAKQDALVWVNEGEGAPIQNIKTVGGQSLQGSGDIPFPTAPVQDILVNSISAVRDHIAIINVPRFWDELDFTGAPYITQEALAPYVTTYALENYHDPSKQDTIDSDHKLWIDYVEGFETVAKTGSYNDLRDRPTIPNVPITQIQVNSVEIVPASGVVNITFPQNVSQFTNDANYITKEVSNLTNYTPTNSLATVATTGKYSDLIQAPTFLSNFTNDLNFMSQNDIEAAYYNKTYVDNNLQGRLIAEQGISIVNNHIFATGLPTVVTLAEGHFSEIAYNAVADYEMIIIYGFKTGPYEYNETSFILHPQAFSSTIGGNKGFKTVSSLGPDNDSIPYSIYAERDGDNIKWYTDEIASSTVFTATRILGLKGVTGE